MSVLYYQRSYGHVFVAMRKIRNVMHKKVYSCSLRYPQNVIDATRAKAEAYDAILKEKQEQFGGRRFNIFANTVKSKYPIIFGINFKIRRVMDGRLTMQFRMALKSKVTNEKVIKSSGMICRPMHKAWEMIVDEYVHHQKLDASTRVTLLCMFPQIEAKVNKYKSDFLERESNGLL